MRLTARRQFAGVQKAQETARKRGGASGTDAASLPLRQDGNPLPEGPGRDSAACPVFRAG
ncbi:hypothetical protein EUW78_20275 [Salmonella enterica subsp. enterica serovar Richmond]|nr:hypothetical protein [Salmonella enterica subsp. enterica serovar Richmond]